MLWTAFWGLSHQPRGKIAGEVRRGVDDVREEVWHRHFTPESAIRGEGLQGRTKIKLGARSINSTSSSV
eukprot:3912902-Rhodomonas_salina.1